MKLSHAVLMTLSATVLGLLIGSVWNTHSKTHCVRKINIELGKVEVLPISK